MGQHWVIQYHLHNGAYRVMYLVSSLLAPSYTTANNPMCPVNYLSNHTTTDPKCSGKVISLAYAYIVKKSIHPTGNGINEIFNGTWWGIFQPWVSVSQGDWPGYQCLLRQSENTYNIYMGIPKLSLCESKLIHHMVKEKSYVKTQLKLLHILMIVHVVHSIMGVDFLIPVES